MDPTPIPDDTHDRLLRYEELKRITVRTMLETLGLDPGEYRVDIDRGLIIPTDDPSTDANS